MLVQWLLPTEQWLARVPRAACAAEDACGHDAVRSVPSSHLSPADSQPCASAEHTSLYDVEAQFSSFGVV